MKMKGPDILRFLKTSNDPVLLTYLIHMFNKIRAIESDEIFIKKGYYQAAIYSLDIDEMDIPVVLESLLAVKSGSFFVFYLLICSFIYLLLITFIYLLKKIKIDQVFNLLHDNTNCEEVMDRLLTTYIDGNCHATCVFYSHLHHG